MGPRAFTWWQLIRVAGVRQLCGEMIVQTCTVEGSVGDVVKGVSCARIETWPCKSKVRESRWWPRERRRGTLKSTDALAVSVSFFAVADV